MFWRRNSAKRESKVYNEMQRNHREQDPTKTHSNVGDQGKREIKVWNVSKRPTSGGSVNVMASVHMQESRQNKVWILTTNFRLTSASRSKGGETHMLVKDSLRMLIKDSLRMVCSKINTFLSIWDLVGIQNFTPGPVKIHGNKFSVGISRGMWRKRPEPKFEALFSDGEPKAWPTKVLDCPLDVIHIGDVKLSFRMEFENGYGIHIQQRFSREKCTKPSGRMPSMSTMTVILTLHRL